MSWLLLGEVGYSCSRDYPQGLGSCKAPPEGVGAGDHPGDKCQVQVVREGPGERPANTC